MRDGALKPIGTFDSPRQAAVAYAIYIYIERERERSIDNYIDIDRYRYLHTFL